MGTQMIPASLLSSDILDEVAHYLYKVKYHAAEAGHSTVSADAAVVLDALIDANGGQVPYLVDTPVMELNTNLYEWCRGTVPDVSLFTTPHASLKGTDAIFTGVSKTMSISFRLRSNSDVPTWKPRFRCRLLCRMAELNILPPIPPIPE